MIEKPPIEILNALWSKVKSYKKISLILGVSRSTVGRWMGPIKYILYPDLFYKHEKSLTSVKKPKWKPKKKNVLKIKKKKPIKNRKKYFKSYFLNKVKVNPLKLEKHRKFSSEYAKKLRATTHLVKLVSG